MSCRQLPQIRRWQEGRIEQIFRLGNGRQAEPAATASIDLDSRAASTPPETVLTRLIRRELVLDEPAQLLLFEIGIDQRGMRLQRGNRRLGIGMAAW